MDYADKKQKTGKRDFMDEKMMQKRVRRTISLIVVIGFVLVATVAGLVFYLRSTLDVAVRRQMKFEALEYKLRLEKQMASDFQLLDTVAALIEENGTTDQTEAIQILSKANQRNDFVTMGFFQKIRQGRLRFWIRRHTRRWKCLLWKKKFKESSTKPGQGKRPCPGFLLEAIPEKKFLPMVFPFTAVTGK